MEIGGAIALQMDDQCGQRIVQGQRFPTGDVLQIEGHAVRYPGARLCRSAISPCSEEWSVRAADVNLGDLRIRCNPINGGRSKGGLARHRNGVRIGGQRRSDRWTRRVQRGHTDITLKGISAGIGKVLNIEATGCGVVQSDLHGRIADDSVSTKRVPLNSRSQEDAICIPEDLVVFDCVVGVDGSGKPDSEIVPLSCVSISADPVRTEPVVACARQSYAAAGSTEASVCYRDIVLKHVGVAAQEYARCAVAGCGHTRDVGTGAAIDYDAVDAEPLNNTWSVNGDAGLLKDPNALLGSGVGRAVTGLWISLPGNAEAVQVERHVGCSYIEAGYATHGARHVTHENAVLADRQRAIDGAADRCRMGASGTDDKPHAKCERKARKYL